MPLVSASNETQAKYCALKFLGVPLKIAGRMPAGFHNTKNTFVTIR